MKRLNLIMFLAVWLFSSCGNEFIEDKSGTIEDVENCPVWMIKTIDLEVATKAVGEVNKFWPVGSTIRLKFLNGDVALQSKVMEYGALWLEYANLKFQYVNQKDSADVKISFDWDEKYISWATIGTDCKAIPQNESSLNFYNLAEETESGIKAEVLRGFGHILGLGFEHRNPGSPLVFADEMDVADEYGLSGTEVEQLINLYSIDQTNYTDYDKASIMTVAVPRALLTKETKIYKTNRNTELSDMDKSFITQIYPFPDIEPLVSTVTTNTQVIIGMVLRENILVDWGDGIKEIVVSEDTLTDFGNVMSSHEYLDNSEHLIKIYGNTTALTSFSLECVGLSFIDIKNNEAIKIINLGENNLMTVNITNSPALEVLNLKQNKITDIDVSSFKYLTYLEVSDCAMNSLDVSKNPNLTYLDCSNNKIKILDVGNCPKLETLQCEFNLLTSLDIKNNSKLIRLDCNDNLIGSLDLSNKTLLGHIYCFKNQLKSLRIHNNPNILILNCSDNLLTALNVDELSKLMMFDCSRNQLRSVNINNNNDISHFYCSNNLLDVLNIGKLSNLGDIDCSANQLTSLSIDVERVYKLICSDNLLRTLNVNNIDEVNCSGNLLTALSIHAKNLDCSNNPLNSLLTDGAYFVNCLGCPFVANEEALLAFVNSLSPFYGHAGTVILDTSIIDKDLLDEIKHKKPYWTFTSL